MLNVSPSFSASERVPIQSHTCAVRNTYMTRTTSSFDSMIHVCSLSRLQETVDDTGARHVVSLLGDEARVDRPASIAPENHLWLRLHDISAPIDGYIAPGEAHVAELISF